MSLITYYYGSLQHRHSQGNIRSYAGQSPSQEFLTAQEVTHVHVNSFWLLYNENSAIDFRDLY